MYGLWKLAISEPHWQSCVWIFQSSRQFHWITYETPYAVSPTLIFHQECGRRDCVNTHLPRNITLQEHNKRFIDTRIAIVHLHLRIYILKLKTICQWGFRQSWHCTLYTTLWFDFSLVWSVITNAHRDYFRSIGAITSIRLSQHYDDVMIIAMASQITSRTIVYSTVYSGKDERKHQSCASLALVRGIHRWPVNSPHKGPVMRKLFPFDDVIMIPEKRR